jgi:hypothetical protein
VYQFKFFAEKFESPTLYLGYDGMINKTISRYCPFQGTMSGGDRKNRLPSPLSGLPLGFCPRILYRCRRGIKNKERGGGDENTPRSKFNI